jgi:hypothetical protein
VQLTATIANTLWTVSNLPAYARFRRALRQPALAQQRKLRGYLDHNAHTAFGKAHGFETIRSYEEFTRRVPLADYDTLAPWIARIRRGETNVLTRDPVTHLIPTSGSTGAHKLIPFTAGSQREFGAAIGTWMVDLQHQSPGLLGGPAYWSVTPVLGGGTFEESTVPIGFDSDTAYLGGKRRRLMEAVMAVPPDVQHAGSIEAFRYKTLLHLLRCRELRLISVWHPSFLTLLLDALPGHWEELLNDVAGGADDSLVPLPGRADQLRGADPRRPVTLWPELRVISCWGNGAAALAWGELQRCFPNIWLQAKGLIATESFVTLPFRGQYPPAIQSHFFEFIDAAGTVSPVEALHEGEEYEVVVTTGGGLWRYRLRDRVLVTGWLEKTPSLMFLARAGNVSDRFGEKLSEPFVAAVLRDMFRSDSPRFALLAPDEDDAGCCYTLFVEGAAQTHWAGTLDEALRQNPHYAYCRDIGQLSTVRVFLIAARGFELFAARQGAQGARLGDIKPTALSVTTGWSNTFSGVYMRPSALVLKPSGGIEAGRARQSTSKSGEIACPPLS